MRIRVAATPQNNSRFGFIIPKKVLPKVTDRNKVKRRLKNIAGKHLTQIRPADILIFPQKISLKKEFNVLEAEFVQNLKRLNLWKS
jgi:ribonuclease P protein component